MVGCAKTDTDTISLPCIQEQCSILSVRSVLATPVSPCMLGPGKPDVDDLSVFIGHYCQTSPSNQDDDNHTASA